MAVNEPVIITVVYGASEVIDRRNLWTALETFAQQCADIPWMVGGDFNAVRDLNEVCGISGDIRMPTEEFNAVHPQRSLWKRLDRILINDRWLARFPNSIYHSLTPRTFDHSPLNIWHHDVVGVPMYAVTRKLKALKPVFRLQRRNKGDLTLNVQLAKGFLDEAQQLRAKMQWMKDGDQCSRVFYRGTRRRSTVDIRYLRPWARHCITDEEANHLLLPFSPNDVKQAVFDIAEDKAPGPNGYSSGFFKAAWPVVGEEVTRAVLDFFSTEKILKQVNSTILALIPKVHTPMSVNDFRPISCCNVLYKIIAKLLVQRLGVLLDKIVSPCQTAFISGRIIGDNIMLAQELFSGYNQKRLPPRCALKVDIRKAYDTVESDFLLVVL
ncbi:UNVERIFIED_CONTAM: hypothetical protein Sindi_1830900 [Sesamum indicum]